MESPHVRSRSERQLKAFRVGIALLASIAAAGFVACNPFKSSRQTQVSPIDGQGMLVQQDTGCLRLVILVKSPGAAADSITKARACALRLDTLRRRRMQAIAAAELQRHGEIVMDVPEFHDEQRLATEAPPRLGPTVGIFTSPFLDAFKFPYQYREHGNNGVLAAYVVVDSEPGDVLPGSYRDMNLRFGLNCVFLVGTGEPGSTYIAKVGQPMANRACRAKHGAVGSSVTFPVHFTGVAREDMVYASRFEDDAAGRPVFGVPCLGGWCRIGRPGFVPGTTFCAWGAFVSCTRREELVAGWYDEQQWDELLPGNRWVSTNLRAAIVPRRDIDQNSVTTFNAATIVADLYFRTAPPINSVLHAKGARQGHNTLTLHHAMQTDGSRKWQFTITPVTNPLPAGVNPVPIDLHGGRHLHFDAAVPGSVRFRFTMLDPGVWAPCGQACCPSGGT